MFRGSSWFSVPAWNDRQLCNRCPAASEWSQSRLVSYILIVLISFKWCFSFIRTEISIVMLQHYLLYSSVAYARRSKWFLLWNLVAFVRARGIRKHTNGVDWKWERQDGERVGERDSESKSERESANVFRNRNRKRKLESLTSVHQP